MKKLATLMLAALLVLFAFTGCGSKYNSLEQILKKGEIVLYTDAVWAPFEYIGEGGNPVGVDIDIAQAIADDLGVSLRIVNASFDGISMALQNGQADMAIAAITITEERQKSLDFSIPYVESRQYILTQESNNTIQYIDDLAGLKVGVHLGTTGDFLVTDEIDDGVLTGTGTTVLQYKSLQEGCMALLKGDLDAIVVDDFTAKNYVAVNPGLKCYEATYADGHLDEEYYGVAITKGNTTLLEAINKVVQAMIDNGEIDASLSYHIIEAAIT